MCRVAMDAACAHLVLVGTRNPLRAVVLLDVSGDRPGRWKPDPTPMPTLLVTALNSAPVIFYPTDTFA